MNSWTTTVITLSLITIYACYDNIMKGLWSNAILFVILSFFCLNNYRKSLAEMAIRTSQEDYQDQYINRALKKCEELEQEIHELKIQIESLE